MSMFLSQHFTVIVQSTSYLLMRLLCYNAFARYARTLWRKPKMFSTNTWVKKIQNRSELINATLCQYEGNFASSARIFRKCQHCGVLKLRQQTQSSLDMTHPNWHFLEVEWQRWEKVETHTCCSTQSHKYTRGKRKTFQSFTGQPQRHSTRQNKGNQNTVS